jgi:3-isopropylmalate/(R)-2-methylmalate dehydratase small subunit
MQPFESVTSTTIGLPAANIDTDQIIPARFLKTTSQDGLGQHLFADWRFGADGQPRADFPLNRPEAQGAAILVAGDNFGCGSSREHAPWALLDFGIRAVISTAIADIFRNNAGRNGLLAVVVSPDFHQHLLTQVPGTVTVDLLRQVVETSERAERFEIEAFARFCMLNGQDPLDYLLSLDPQISAYEESLT